MHLLSDYCSLKHLSELHVIQSWAFLGIDLSTLDSNSNVFPLQMTVFTQLLPCIGCWAGSYCIKFCDVIIMLWFPGGYFMVIYRIYCLICSRSHSFYILLYRNEFSNWFLNGALSRLIIWKELVPLSSMNRGNSLVLYISKRYQGLSNLWCKIWLWSLLVIEPSSCMVWDEEYRLPAVPNYPKIMR